MIHQLRAVWGDYLQPMLRRPERLQVAALCYSGEEAERRVILITSRGTGRWILPKGWPIEGTDAAGSAMQEAWEEAGVRKGRTATEAIGSVTYEKGLPGNWSVPVRMLIYPVEVEELRDDYPEADERRRIWVSPADAARMVDEPELKRILSTF